MGMVTPGGLRRGCEALCSGGWKKEYATLGYTACLFSLPILYPGGWWVPNCMGRPEPHHSVAPGGVAWGGGDCMGAQEPQEPQQRLSPNPDGISWGRRE